MEDVVLAELLRTRGLLTASLPGVDNWIVANEDVPMERVMHEAARLRAAGKSVEFALRHQTVPKQLKAAKSRLARAKPSPSNKALPNTHARRQKLPTRAADFGCVV